MITHRLVKFNTLYLFEIVKKFRRSAANFRLKALLSITAEAYILFIHGENGGMRMTKKYFPGANTGRGFISHFSGIVPPWEPRHYTYILKGGPGVGKNTLMKKVACLARANGLETEEFRCASDPGSLDAVRIPQKKLVLVDGTAPHTLDPAMPGLEGEILDLGYFLHREAFARRYGELQLLFEENREHYAEAYACLGAAGTLCRTAAAEAAKTADLPMIRDFLKSSFPLSAPGGVRSLFLCSPTPEGVIDLHETLGAQNTVYLPGILGTVFLQEAIRIARGTKLMVFSDPLTPELPQYLYYPDSSTLLCAIDDPHSTLNEFLLSPLPEFTAFALAEAERLTVRAVEALRLCKRTHDAIEALYRPYVDYSRVDRETQALLEALDL